MVVMVTGGTGRREVDRFLAGGALDRLHSAARIQGLIPSPCYEANDAASEWWQKRFFGLPVWKSSTFVEPDVVIILPGPRAVIYLQEAIQKRRFAVVVDDVRNVYLDGSGVVWARGGDA